MDFKNALVFFGILLNIYFASLIHIRSEKNIANKVFKYTIYAICGWCLSMLFYRSVASNVEFWSRMLYFFPTFIPTGFLIFGLYFPNYKVKKLLIFIIVFLNLIMAIMCLVPGAVIERVIVPPHGERIIHFGWAYYYLYLVYIPAFFFASYIVLFRKYKKSSSTVRKQIITILTGLFIASSVGMVSNLVLPTLGIFEVNWAGQFFTFIWVGSATYAVIKHGFLNVKVLATQLFTVVILLVLLTRLFTFTSLSSFLIDLVIFVVVLVFSVLLVRSVMGEVKQKERLEHLTRKLKELDKQKDEFISVAAHELRTPLTAINGYVSMLLDGDMGELPGGAIELLDNTSLAANRMIRLINNLLDVGRIEEGRIVYRMGYVNLADVVKTVYAEFEQEAKMRKLELHLEIQKDIKDRVWVDGDRIHEVVGNLLSNAFKYTEKGSVDVKALNSNEGFVRVEVKDTGLGISTDDQKKLFKKYYRSKSSKGKIEGTGLGLYVTRLLVEKFGGSVGVTSKVDKGSTFWYELPLAKGDEEMHKSEEGSENAG